MTFSSCSTISIASSHSLSNRFPGPSLGSLVEGLSWVGLDVEAVCLCPRLVQPLESETELALFVLAPAVCATGCPRCWPAFILERGLSAVLVAPDLVSDDDDPPSQNAPTAWTKSVVSIDCVHVVPRPWDERSRCLLRNRASATVGGSLQSPSD